LLSGRHQLGDRPTVPGEDDLIATLDPIQQGRQLVLGLEGSDLVHHPDPAS
jgi:hypothetical protein